MGRGGEEEDQAERFADAEDRGGVLARAIGARLRQP